MKLSVRAYFISHRDALTSSCRQLLNYPFSSLLTIAVLGVAFSLPCCLWVVLTNAKTVSHGWQNTMQMSLFLDKSLDRDEARVTLKQVREHEGVQFANFISPEQGLQTLEEQTGMVDVSRLLEENPLPAVIEVHPDDISSDSVKRVFSELEQMKGVNFAKMDMEWLDRLESIFNIADHASSGFQVLFAFAVLLVVGNTIRLAVQNRHKEVEVLKLIGATNRFIRRPFLYVGLLYGLLGALIAWLVVGLLVNWVADATSHLASLYHTDFKLRSLGVSYGLNLVAAGLILGYLGARLAVARQIRVYEPK